MQVNYGLGEKAQGPWMSEYVDFVHGIDRVLIVRETWFGYDCLKIVPQSCFVERNANDVRDYIRRHYPFILEEQKGKFETYLRDEISNHIGKLVVLHFTIPDTSAPKHGTGSGTSSDLQTLENKSQNINSMTNIDRIVLLLALTFKKMGKNIFNSFSMSDLYMIAGMFALWAGSQFFGVGEVIDAALMAWLWWTIGWDCWHFLVIIINSVKTAIQATSIQQIDDAASELAPAAAALGIDALMGFILHKFGKGSAVEEAAKKEIKIEEDLVKQDFGQNPALRTVEEVTSKKFTPLGLSDDEATNFLNSSVGEKMFDTIAEAHPDWSVNQIKDQALEAINSGKTLPQQIDNFEGTLYKIQNIKYSSVSENTIYFTTQEEINKAAAIASRGGPSIGEQFGLPQSSIANQYSIMPMQANSSTTIFKSIVAPTVENGITTPGGAAQYFIFNQAEFSPLAKSGTLTNNGILGK